MRVWDGIFKALASMSDLSRIYVDSTTVEAKKGRNYTILSYTRVCREVLRMDKIIQEVVIRYERLAVTYRAFINIACIIIHFSLNPFCVGVYRFS
jgi:hypothetical protein